MIFVYIRVKIHSLKIGSIVCIYSMLCWQSGVLPENTNLKMETNQLIFSSRLFIYNVKLWKHCKTKNQSLNVSARGIQWHVLHILTVHQVCRVLKAKILMLLQETSWFFSRLLGCQQGRDILSLASAAAPPWLGPPCKLMKLFPKPEDNVRDELSDSGI